MGLRSKDVDSNLFALASDPVAGTLQLWGGIGLNAAQESVLGPAVYSDRCNKYPNPGPKNPKAPSCLVSAAEDRTQ